MEYERYDVAVVGGGPAGLMAAGRAAEMGAKVVLLEKNSELGKKLLLTGKGRCNFAHAEADQNAIVKAFGRNGRFLYSALSAFGVNDVMDFFRDYGVESQIERGNRIFPRDGNAHDVLNALIAYMAKGNVKVIRNARIINVEHRNGKALRLILQDGELEAKNFILCTGGKSYSVTGSTGDGYRWARQSGHRIIEPVPAICPVKTEEKWCRDLQGLSLKNVSLKLYRNGKKISSRFGEMLFTHFGISGPIVMDMASEIGEILREGKAKPKLRLDLKAALDFSTLDRRIQRDFAKFKGKLFKNSLGDLLPVSMIPVMVKLSEIELDRRVDDISREERHRLVHLFKELELTPTELLGFRWAVITRGGISLKNVESKTLRSKIVENLYFAGEILDLDAPTGGYNLQECWSTGRLAGESAARAVLNKD